MKILLGWSSTLDDYKTKKLISAMEEKSHQVVYWVGTEKNPDIQMPGMIVQTYESARLCQPAPGLSMSDFPPVGEDIIGKLHKEESLILGMMNKQLDWMCVDERKHLYYNMLSYWHGVIQKYKPDLVLLTSLPHTAFTHVIYALAKLFGIKVIMFDGVVVGEPLGDRMLMYVDSWKKSAALEKAWRKNKEQHFSLEHLSQDLQDYYRLHTKESFDPTPVYIKDDKKLYSFSNVVLLKIKIILRSIKDGTLFEKILSSITKISKENIKQEYQHVQKEADLKQKFVYLPLHYQPECTTNPLGDIFADQILMIEILSASLPPDWLLYVKEHPTQWFSRGLNFFSSRYRGYYKRIARLTNVRLIPIKTNNYDLIRHAQAVVTVTGTAGFEALIRGKPTIVFGYPWYMDCPGVFKVNGVSSCKNVLEEIKKGIQIKEQDIINFLKSLDEASFHGNETIEDIQCRRLNIKERKSMDNSIKAILSELEKYA
ncbi:MAG: hypothetical protein HYT28_00130 [Parcubacteria group bacterium]|nr:hypothetical protein [Parcubacteria group bacterium]